MFTFLSKFFQKKQIDCYAPLPIAECRMLRPYLLERAGIRDGTVILMAIPYYTPACDDPRRNLSAYAVPRDYHLFFEELYGELLPLLQEQFPTAHFACFADHSPIDEVEAAAKAGLGCIGKNHMLLTEKYASYVFLGELFTDVTLPASVHEIATCEHCGACMRACPARKTGTCLSALTQKKGALTREETEAILQYGSVWGCDLCQESCPHTKRARASGSIYSPIPFFEKETLVHLTQKDLDAMDDATFAHRAYAWRKRETIARNLTLFEKGEAPCSS